jgi:hypothetical protein
VQDKAVIDQFKKKSILIMADKTVRHNFESGSPKDHFNPILVQLDQCFFVFFFYVNKSNFHNRHKLVNRNVSKIC